MNKMFATLFAAAAMCCACSSGGNDTPDPAPSTNKGLSLTPTEISVAADATTQTVTVTAEKDWGVNSEDTSWCTVSPSGGTKGSSTLTAKIAENKSGDVRATNLVFRMSGAPSVTLNVRQNYKVDAVTVADAAFRKYLIDNFDVDHDGVLSTKEAAAVTQIAASGLGIASMDEVNTVFTKITKLDCSNNRLTSLPVDALSQMKELNCSNNQLTELNIETLVGLEKLNATGNPNLKTIYVWSGFQAPAGFQIPAGCQYVEPEFATPAGYKLVWQDEFNTGETLGKDWTHEVQGSGWVNNEEQNYVNGQIDGKRVTEVGGGVLKINCFKHNGKIYSGRVYAKVNTGWLYGYFEARIKLPSGKGTWPAFWMMPVNNNWSTNPWPRCGEIDIMEEVGVVPNEVSSSIHCDAYNHTKGTQKTAARNIGNAEGAFHIYACEWTPTYLRFYVDGKELLTFRKESDDHSVWPFHYAFYPILNLAWGGSWGGMRGTDESALPVTMEVDYVRVFQKVE